MKAQTWIAYINDTNGTMVARKVFDKGTSSENYEAAHEEYVRMLDYEYFGFDAAPGFACIDNND